MKTKILTAIKFGGPIERHDLSILTNLPDRKVREMIAELQKEGHHIVSLKRGYFIATNGELEAYVRRERKRAISILSKIKHLCPASDNAIKQLSIFDVDGKK